MADRSGLLAGFMVGMGVTHFAKPAWFDAIVPRALPGPARAYTLASGAAEVLVGLGLAYPGTRRQAAPATAGLQMALDGGMRGVARRQAEG